MNAKGSSVVQLVAEYLLLLNSLNYTMHNLTALRTAQWMFNAPCTGLNWAHFKAHFSHAARHDMHTTQRNPSWFDAACEASLIDSMTP